MAGPAIGMMPAGCTIDSLTAQGKVGCRSQQGNCTVPTFRKTAGQARNWLQSQYALAQLCHAAAAADEARYLRSLCQLLRNAPNDTCLDGIALPAESRFEAMLQAGCATEAALCLLGKDCGYMLSRGSDGCHLASIILPGRLEEATASGASAALALAAAVALALCDMPMLPGEAADLHETPELRLN